MARASQPRSPAPLDDALQRRLREVGFLLLLPLAIYLFACLASYAPADPGWRRTSTSSPASQTRNPVSEGVSLPS